MGKSLPQTPRLSQFDQGCFKCGGHHLAQDCPKRERGSSQVVGAQIEIDYKEEEELATQVQVKVDLGEGLLNQGGRAKWQGRGNASKGQRANE